MLAVAALVMTLSSGNAFAVHVGMMNPPAGSAEELVGGDHGGKTFASALAPIGNVTPAGEDGAIGVIDSGGAMPMDRDAQHLMHLLGACSAVLLALALVASIAAWWTHRIRSSYLSSTRGQRLVVEVAAFAWRPPPLRPPTSSPVIRT